MTRVYAILAGVAVIALLGVTYFVTQRGGADGEQFAQCRGGAVVGGAGAIGGPFTLVSETGETVTEEDVIDKPSLIYFGYTFCPDVCPIDNARNVAAVEMLEERGEDVKPVFITVDPERDTAEVMREFTDAFHPDLLGLTGSEEQVKVATNAYRAFSSRQDSDDPDYYLVDHSTFTYLTLPEHGFVEFFRRDDTAEQMADRVQCYLDAS
ncbi:MULTISPECIES: SCO family protein [unclassified Roseovarius]|uniref:SCO family protein n=1 Tax=unclassified Roseovarius TaxID=2614913 RepID=UPI00273D72C8|nr:SCO family protein [Roseovarius sp. MMSF_3350]